MHWEYLTERVRRYNAQPSDDLLYRIGTHADVFSVEEVGRMALHQQHGQNLFLLPRQRYRVLNWLVCNGFEVEGDLALLIFGREQLTRWLEVSRQAYPDFEFYLVFESHSREQSGWEDGINFTMHWAPKPGAPVPDTDNDFPWKSFWESGEMFWGNFPGGGINGFEFNLHCYPTQETFTKAGWVCEAGDWHTTPDERDANLMSIAQVLQHFTVQV